MDSIEQKIADIAAKQKADHWAARQEAAARQQAEEATKKLERYRSQRCAAIKAQLDGIPGRRKHAEMQAREAEELATVLAAQVDKQANNYAQNLHAERHGGRALRLDLGSSEAIAFFHGATIKKGLRQLAMTINQRSFGQPLLDPESFAAALKAEEQQLRNELAELQLQG